MPRTARIVLPGTPHHVTQRGNRRQITFFKNAHYRHYVHLMFYFAARHNIEVFNYCLMPNHVHLILVPRDKKSLSKFMAILHLTYTNNINRENDWQGCLWQGRFYSVPLVDEHVDKAVAYVELNPVRAGLVEQPWEWSWSSAHVNAVYDDSGIDDIRRMTLRGKPDDTAAVKARILEATGIDISVKPRGRRN